MANYTWSNDQDAAVKNKLGAKTHAELEEREGAYLFARYQELEAGLGPTGQFDAAHLKAIHRHLFQDVYEWAGRTRDEKVRLSDGTVATEPLMRKAGGDPFLAGPKIGDALQRIGETLRRDDYLRGLPRDEFAERAADVMAAINGAHPFREGNGRTQRIFLTELALKAGHDLDFTVVSKERMIQASIAANDKGDAGLMRRMFVEISDPERVAALKPAIRSLEKYGVAWNDQYLSTSEPGHEVELTMAGVAGKHFMARTKSTILIGNSSDLPLPHPESSETFILRPAIPLQSAHRDGKELGAGQIADTKEAREAGDPLDRSERYRRQMLEKMANRPADRLLNKGQKR